MVTGGMVLEVEMVATAETEATVRPVDVVVMESTAVVVVMVESYR